jgi:hypothetical protein
MVAAFPIVKLGALLIKQVSKPLANLAKRRAKSSPFFRTYICMPPAQAYHWVEVKMKMLSMNVGKPVAIPKLNEAMAIELGAELVGEGVIFIITAAILVAEYARGARKAAAEEEERKQEISQIQTNLMELRQQNNKLETELQELFKILHVNIPPVPNQNEKLGNKAVSPPQSQPPTPAPTVTAAPAKQVSGQPNVK